jgi:hypothetical protein
VRVHSNRRIAQLATAVVDFPGTSQQQGNSPAGAQPVLVQLKLDRAFVETIDRWRKARPDLLPRTRAICELAMLGLAGELIGKPAKRRRRK